MEKGKASILIVDDDKSILRVFTRILQREGYATDVAETGEEALQKISAKPFNTVLIDMKLPDMDGTDLLKKIHAARSSIIPIAITGFPSIESGLETLDEGAVAYLVKPVRPNELLKLIEEKLKAQKETQSITRVPKHPSSES